MFAKVSFLLCIAAVALSRPDKRPQTPSRGYGYAPPVPSYSAPAPSYAEPEEDSHEEGMPFEYSYAVKDEYSGNDFGHESESDGDVTKGEYHVLLPDGRTQIVTYTADHENGFVAEVRYEGEARPYEAHSEEEEHQEYKLPIVPEHRTAPQPSRAKTSKSLSRKSGRRN